MIAPRTPRLALAGLDVRRFRSLQRVEWPKDGLGWQDRVPDIVLVGGINGSGKTTLLELLFGVVRFMVGWRPREARPEVELSLLPRGAERVTIDLEAGANVYSITVGSQELASATRRHQWSIWVPPPDESDAPAITPSRESLHVERENLAKDLGAPDGPSLLYFPTDRTVPFPPAPYKGPGRRAGNQERIYRYRPPQDWEHSVEAVLYDARWRDLNARERGHSAKNFAAYEAAMHTFFGDSKSLQWDDDGALQVVTRDGARHPLEALSSGEKQVLLFAAELFRRWTPGSLVLIDEPELHLHEAWLAALWGAICKLQRERGGQVIITTQSNYLFGLGEPGSRVLLGRGL